MFLELFSIPVGGKGEGGLGGGEEERFRGFSGGTVMQRSVTGAMCL